MRSRTEKRADRRIVRFVNLSEMLTLLPRLGYDHSEPKTQAAQQALYKVRREPPDGVPLGLDVRVSGQGINLPVVPWITLLDPGLTKKVTEGLYLVYLYAADLQSVFLTMNQGTTAHKELQENAGLSGRAAERAALEELQQETEAIRFNLAQEFPELPKSTSSSLNPTGARTAHESTTNVEQQRKATASNSGRNTSEKPHRTMCGRAFRNLISQMS